VDRPDASWLVVGLGNPGPAFAGNRHNVGAMVVRELGSRHDLGALAVGRLARRRDAAGSFKAHRARAIIDEIRLGTGPDGSPGRRVVLAVPTTFMNESGASVAGLMAFFSVDLDHLVVVHDELDIAAGTVRVKRGGGESGHNGLRSVSRSLGSKDYFRVRVGIGRPPGRMDPADFVLRDFSAAERAELPLTLDTAADAVESLVAVGLLASQQRFHAGQRPD
jgi:PTH1 family peptidyl-tRNA hydrolase